MNNEYDTASLEATVLAVAGSGQHILKSSTEEFEDASAAAVGWQAVGTSSVFSAVLLLALTAESAEPIRGDNVSADAAAAILAAKRSRGAAVSHREPLTSGWDLFDWPHLHSEVQHPERSTVVIVRELSSAAAASTLGFDAVIWDVAGSREITSPGEVAVIFARREMVVDHIRAVQNHGQPVEKGFQHEQVGINARVDDAVASYLVDELQTLVERRTNLRESARSLMAALTEFAPRYIPDLHEGGGIILPARAEPVVSVFRKAGARWRATAGGYLVSVPMHLDARGQQTLLQEIATVRESVCAHQSSGGTQYSRGSQLPRNGSTTARPPSTARKLYSASIPGRR